MGSHKVGLVAIGAFVDDMLCDYIDKVADEHGFSTRSDAIRMIISEHQAVFSNRIDRNTALKPLEGDGNDNPQGSVSKSNKR